MGGGELERGHSFESGLGISPSLSSGRRVRLKGKGEVLLNITVNGRPFHLLDDHNNTVSDSLTEVVI